MEEESAKSTRAMISPTNCSIPNQQQNFHSGNLLSPGVRSPFGSAISRHLSGLQAPGSSWLDPRRSPGGRGSPRSGPHGSGSPSYGSSGRGASWSDPRGRGSSGRRQAWMNSRGRGGRGLRGSPSPDQVQGGRESRVHASARERSDLFVKKSMVEDPWKNLVPMLMDSLEDIEIGNTKMFRSKGVSLI